MSALAVLPMLASASPVIDTHSMCSIIAADLPGFCKCSDLEFGGKASCAVNLLGRDTISTALDFEPCAEIARLELSVSESAHNFETKLNITAGEEYKFHVPGAKVNLPGINDASLTVSAQMSGNANRLTAMVSLDICGTMADQPVCASDMFKNLPITVINGSWTFSDVCGQSAFSVSV